MTEPHLAAEHHAKAALHHTQAAQYHSQSARHYESGKDYNHAAHQALVAHGHSLTAIRAGDEARLHYADHHLSTFQRPADPVARIAVPFAANGAPTTVLSAAQHHTAAAVHHEQAARHHHEAAKLCGAREYARAAHEAQMAHRHAHYSVFHDDEAAMHHVEHYGKSGQSAEIS